jgi:hypothetical protein
VKLIAENTRSADKGDKYVHEVRMWVHEEDVDGRWVAKGLAAGQRGGWEAGCMCAGVPLASDSATAGVAGLSSCLLLSRMVSYKFSVRR